MIISAGFRLRELLEQELPELLEQGKTALNELALREFNEAPFVQWALVSSMHFIELEQDSPGQGEEYLQMALRGVSYAGELATASIGRFGESFSRRALLNAISHLECAADDCITYRKTHSKSELLEATAQLKLAIVESIFAIEHLRERAA